MRCENLTLKSILIFINSFVIFEEKLMSRTYMSLSIILVKQVNISFIFGTVIINFIFGSTFMNGGNSGYFIVTRKNNLGKYKVEE